MPCLIGFSWKLFVLILLLSINPVLIHAQRIKNPSFEGSRDGNILPFWENCGGPLSTPDIQPGNWGVVFPPDDGNTYLGLVFRIRDSGSFESVTQNLSYPFHKDSTYTFEISLAFDPDYEDPNSRQPGILKIWGGNSLCATSENLWNSPVIAHKGWQTYTVNFSPKETHSAITLQGYFASRPFYNRDILIDNIKNFQACPKPKPFIGKDIVICGNQEYTIDASAVSGPFLWQDGSSNNTLKVTKSGKYWVQAYINGCRTSDTINVTFKEPLSLDLGADIETCEGEQVTFSLNIPNANYKWNN
jgi:hypothetical protein